MIAQMTAMKRSLLLLPVLAIVLFFAFRSSPAKIGRQFVEAGDRYAQKADWSAAAIEYRNALKRTPDSADAHARLVDAALKLGDVQTVASERLWAARQAPHDVAAQVAAGEACLGAGRFADAESVLDGAIAMAPKDPDANRAIGSLFMLTGRASLAERYWAVVASAPDGDPFALADYYASVGRNADANRELARLLTIPGMHDAAALRLARFEYAHGEEDKGDKTLDAAIAENDRNAAAWMLRGQMQLRDQPAAAHAAFTKALEIDPSSVDALQGLVLADVASGRSADAVARVEQRLSTAPQDAPLLMLAARTYASAQKYDKAEQTLIHLVEVDPSNGDAYQMLGRIYLTEGKVDAARQKFERVAAMEPYSIAPNTVLGMLLQAQGQTAAAQQKYEQILKGNPRAAIAANNLAWIYLNEGRLDDALYYARVASEELPRAPEANDTLGWVYYTRKEPLYAIPALAAATEADPENASYHFHLGAAYAAAKESAAARRELDRALSLSTSFSGHEEAVRMLGQLALR
jgi:tetratricopeptide (TPR) repeat protein